MRSGVLRRFGGRRGRRVRLGRRARPRDQFDQLAQVIGRREADPPRVPCGVAHRYEVFWVGPLDGDRYPGEAALDALAARIDTLTASPSPSRS